MVRVYNREVGQERLQGFTIRLGDSTSYTNNPICSYNNAAPYNTVLLPCKGRGRYLTFELSGSARILTLCEVFAWGPQPGWDWASECNNCPAGAHSAAAGAPPRLRPLRYMH